MTIVDELEVIDVQHDQRERILIAHRGGHRLRELVLEGPLVGQVGQPVAGRALKRYAMVAHQPPPASQVEDAAAAEQREQADQQQHQAHFSELRVVRSTVIGHLIGVATAQDLDWSDELKAMALVSQVAVGSRIRRPMFECGEDSPGVVHGADQRIVTRCPDNVLRVDEDRAQRARTLFDDI